MKRFLAFLTAVLFAGQLSVTGVAYATSSFRDVPASYKYFTSITTLAQKGVVRGYSDRQFRPENTINRAEAIKILVEANFSRDVISNALAQHRQMGHSYINLPDVSLQDWFGPHFELAYIHNIVQGYPDHTFKPANSMNFAEGLKMILGTYKLNANSAPFTYSKLIAVESTDWSAPYFNYARAYNLISPNKFYHPAQLMTRGEFVEILHRVQTVKTDGSPFTQNNTITSAEYNITIPRLNIINQPVSFADPYDAGSALEVLRHSPFGHYLASPETGEKFVLYGHSSGYAWDQSPYKVVLRQINQLRAGDKIYINYKEKGYVYQIYKNDIIPATQDTSILADGGGNEMAIYTCWPPDSVSSRYVVYGKPL
ncbi:hypothetical protein COY07_05535 [Candidatus Peregrinibacteria bacterium CG_4_10_14_0_2_um_filter_43_11]|nr:MAG: hypothetical protein COY07_05535 [Candidatus Peregrinibacteria bacterium CG_4_10_14_0_2_um_filter_43_11]